MSKKKKKIDINSLIGQHRTVQINSKFDSYTLELGIALLNGLLRSRGTKYPLLGSTQQIT